MAYVHRDHEENILPILMINENIERKKQFCGGSLFVTKSQLQSSTLQKNEVLHWYFRDFLRIWSVPILQSSYQWQLQEFPWSSIHLELYLN